MSGSGELPQCPRCKERSWVYNVTTTTYLASGSTTVTKKEFRCFACGKKANIDITDRLLNSHEFMMVQLQDTHTE